MSAAIVRVDFHGDAVECLRDDAGVWVGVKRVCESLGLGYSSQLQKLKSKPWAGVTTIVTPSEGGPQPTSMLPLDALPMWLATIEASRVAPAIKPKLVAYQRECVVVLRDHFFAKPSPEPTPLPAAAVDVGKAAAAIELALEAGAIDKAGAALRLAALVKASSGYDVLAVPEGLSWQQAVPQVADLAEGERLIVTKPVDRTGHYSASEIGAPHGLSGKAIGAIADQIGIKGNPAYGKWSPITDGSGKKVGNQWLYNAVARDELGPKIQAELVRHASKQLPLGKRGGS